MKKFLRSSMFIGAMVAMFVTLSSLFAPSVFAAGNNGSQTTAYQKLWHSALRGCINTDIDEGWYLDTTYGFLGLGGTGISAQRVRSGGWFSTAGDSWNPFNDNHGGYAWGWGGGAYVENAVTGEYSDGKIYCGENDNGLVSKGLQALGISTLDVACNYKDGHATGGVLSVSSNTDDVSESYCVDRYNSSDSFRYWRNSRGNYFDELVTEKTFGGNVPGGSLNVITDLESYYIRKVTFEIVCAEGGPHFGDDRPKYQVVAWNPSTNKFEHAGYSQKNPPDEKVYYWGGNEATCQELADSINQGSSQFNAYKEEKLQDAKDGCVREYNAELDKIKKYRDDYGAIANAGLNFVSTIDHMLNGLTSGKVPTVTYIGAQPGAPLSPPIVEAYTNYIDSQLSTVLAKINGESVYTENAFNQLAAAAKSVLSHSDISDDGTVNSTATDNDIAQAKDWVEKANDLVTVVRENYNSLNSFITSHSTSASGVVTWTYENEEEINVICPGKATLSNEWSDFQKNLPGAPDVDGEFNQDEYIDTQDGDGSTSIELTCMNSGGAESLGWIVCPVLDWMTRASGQLYNNYIVPALQVKPKLFEERTGDSNDTFDVWGIFQGFANVLFIILLLAVIFSQLTGVGIDNYGIKKILPKLLVAAILVNLSYYICVALVDVSNIVGNSLQAMFDGMASGLSAPLPGGGGSGAGATAITAVLILGGLAEVGVAIWQNPAILLTLLVAALGVVISILFLFVILSAREAAIVVLTVISPLAFACYMLPNTKKLFDKWLKIWEGLLLVYPICGLLVGGGNFMSKLMLSATGAGTDGSGFFGSFTAMLIGIVPIFFIPTVLKGSFAAMGNLGAKISGFGDRMRGGVTRGIRNSEGFRNAQKLGLERRTRKKAGLDKNGNLTKSGERRANLAQTRFGRLIGADKRRAAYINAAKRDVATGEEANASLTNALSRSAIAANGGNAEAYYTDQFEQAASSGNIRGMNAALAAAVSSGYLKDKDIAKIVRNAQNAGKINIKDAATRAAWMRDAATKYGNGFLATDFEMRHWMQNGGSNTLGDFGAYAASAKANGDPMIGVDDIKPEDIPRLSGDSLAGLAQAGILTASMAQQVMAKNPNISADKRIMLGAIASGAANDASIVAASVAAGNIGASVLKEEAKALMLNPSATTWTDKNGATHPISAIRITDDTAAQVNSWTAPTPVAANVVQDFSSGYSGQIEPVDVQIRGATNTAGVVAPAAPSSNAPSSTGSSSGIILDSSGEQARQAMREFDARERARGNRNWPGNSNS